MKSGNSEDWLAFLLYALDLGLNPKPYKILQSYEAWEFENRLRPQLYRLQRARLLEHHGRGENRAWLLTEQGRLAACGGIDPLPKWQRPWDGKWRLLLFDLPVGAHHLRLKLWRWLRAQRFGLLQRSVWVSPDAVDEAALPLARLRLKPESFTVIEGRPRAPVSDADLVKSAWDFGMINSRYQAALDLSARGLALAEETTAKSVELRQWLAAERLAWLAALSADPLLPDRLLPSAYPGREAFKQRQAAYAALARRGLGPGTK